MFTRKSYIMRKMHHYYNTLSEVGGSAPLGPKLTPEQIQENLKKLKDEEREMARTLRDLYVKRMMAKNPSIIDQITRDIETKDGDLKKNRNEQQNLHLQAGNKFAAKINKEWSRIKDSARPSIPVTTRTLGLTPQDIENEYTRKKDELEKSKKQRSELAKYKEAQANPVQGVSVGITEPTPDTSLEKKPIGDISPGDNQKPPEIIALEKAKEVQSKAIKDKEALTQRSTAVNETKKKFDAQKFAATSEFENLFQNLPKGLREKVREKVLGIQDASIYLGEELPLEFETWELEKKMDFLQKKQTFYQRDFSNIFYQEIISDIVKGYNSTQDTELKKRTDALIREYALEQKILEPEDPLTSEDITKIVSDPGFISYIAQDSNVRLKSILSLATTVSGGLFQELGQEKTEEFFDTLQKYTLGKARSITVSMHQIQIKEDEQVNKNTLQYANELVQFEEQQVENRIQSLDQEIAQKEGEVQELESIVRDTRELQGEDLEKLDIGETAYFYEKSEGGYLVQYDIEKIGDENYRIKFDGEVYIVQGPDWKDQLSLLKTMRSIPVISLFLSSPTSSSHYRELVKEFGGPPYNAKPQDNPERFIAYFYERILSVLPASEFKEKNGYQGLPKEEKGRYIMENLRTNHDFSQEFYRELQTAKVIKSDGYINWSRFPDDRQE